MKKLFIAIIFLMTSLTIIADSHNSEKSIDDHKHGKDCRCAKSAKEHKKCDGDCTDCPKKKECPHKKDEKEKKHCGKHKHHNHHDHGVE